jgi:hypothetical protein
VREASEVAIGSKSFVGGAARVAFSCRFEAVVADASDLYRTDAPQTVVGMVMAAAASNTRHRFAVPCTPTCTVAD